MTHETFEAKLLDLAYGELTPREARKVEAHAAGCETCGAELARLRDTRALLSALPPAPAPARGEEVLRAAAREATRRREPAARTLPPWLWSGAVLAVAIAAVGAVSYRLLAMRPGPLGRDERDILLGTAPEAPEAAAPAAAPRAEAPAPAAGGALAEGHRGDAPGPRAAAGPAREDAAADRRAAATERPELERRTAAPSRKAAPGAFAAAPPPESERDATPPAPARPDEAPAELRRSKAPRAPAPAAETQAPLERYAQSPPELDAESRAPAAPSAAGAPRAVPSPAVRPAPLRSRADAAPPSAADTSGREPATPADPVARYAALRAAGALRGEVQAFPGCPGESFRKVERDARGRVVKYTRRGEEAGERFEAELFYREDGALAVVRWRVGGGGWREARLDGASAAGALPAVAQEPRRADEVDGPPRCGR